MIELLSYPLIDLDEFDQFLVQLYEKSDLLTLCQEMKVTYDFLFLLELSYLGV